MKIDGWLMKEPLVIDIPRNSVYSFANIYPFLTSTTRKLRFRESEKTVMKYWFTLMKTIHEGQPSRMSTHGIEAREIEFS
jgi:hypothetical protein